MRCLYQEMSRIPGVNISYFTGKDVLQEMPPAAKPPEWIKNSASIRTYPDFIIFAMRSAHWLAFESRLRKAVSSGRYDLYHETGFIPAKVKGIPTVYTIYDLSLRLFRDKHPKERVWFFDFFLPRRLQYTSHIMTISNYIQDEIHHILDIPLEKISAVPLAPDRDIFSVQDQDTVINVLAELDIPEKYFLFVGSLEPRKNLQLIIKAMAGQHNPVPLVLAGWIGWGDKSWVQEIARLGLEDRIIMPGYLDDRTLAALYNGARGFVYPSLYEGFGLPLLEAMTCGCPVICSSAASLPEVAGDAALYVSPHDASGLARAMQQLADDDDLWREMKEKGLRRAAAFSWQYTAQKTFEIFERL
jgi:alpha-1,3-rhamnosyl/mannosyltransferase